MGDAEGPLYYHDYLQLDRLLSCQALASAERGEPAHDELLFVIVHQAYELWFKQILHELEAVQTIFAGVVDDRDMLRAVGYLGRIAQIERLMIDQVEVLETMTPLDFLDFRDFLFPASGFLSAQFRVIEIGTGAERRISFPEPAYSASPSQNAEWDAAAFRYSYQSMITPSSVYDYDFAGGESRHHGRGSSRSDAGVRFPMTTWCGG